VFLALLAPYWLWVILPNNTEYLVNTASLYYRGPDALWRRLSAYDMTLVVLYAGVIAAAGLTFVQAARKRWDESVLVVVWAAAVFVFLGLTMLRGVGTEYPRFMYPMLQPLSLAAGGAAFLLFRSVSARWTAGAMEPALGSLVAIALLLVLIGPGTAASYRREARAYEMEGLAGLLTSIERTDESLGEDQTILGTVSVGKWAEGISGREALFHMPNRYIFRASERERALSADLILRSTLGITNGQILMRYTQQSDGSPTFPWLTFNHRGEYLDLLQISPFETLITADGLPNTRLSSLSVEHFETYTDEFSMGTETTYSGFIGPEPVTILQHLNLSSHDATLVVDYEITSAADIDLRVLVGPIAGQRTTSVQELEEGAAVSFIERAGANPTIEVKALSGGEIHVGDPTKGEVVARSDGTGRLAFEVSFVPHTQPFEQTGVFWPKDLIQEYRVGAVYLPDGQSLQSRMSRMEALGFRFHSRAGGYVLMVEDAGPRRED
jgi:hypothetical protein